MPETIVVWTKPACVSCNAVKRYLDKRGVQYETRELMENLDKVEEFRQRGYTSAPITEAPGFDLIAGYDDVRLSEVVESHGMVEQ